MPIMKASVREFRFTVCEHCPMFELLPPLLADGQPSSPQDEHIYTPIHMLPQDKHIDTYIHMLLIKKKPDTQKNVQDSHPPEISLGNMLKKKKCYWHSHIVQLLEMIVETANHRE